MRALTLGLRLLGREWRSGELAILMVALIVAVAALTGVSFLVSRISQSVEQQANVVLAADLRLQASQPLGEDYLNEARERRLTTTNTVSVLSVVFRDDSNQLANLRAVGDSYPLRGLISVSDQAFGAATTISGGPPRGEVWPDSKLLAALEAEVGDSVSIGAGTFRIGRVLISRPDQGGGFGELAPSLLMHLDDLAETRLLQPGSRATYSQLFAGEREQILNFKNWLSERKQRGERLQDVSEASPQISRAIERAGQFLSLASLVAVLLCAIAVAMSARRYVQRHLDSVALLKTLGASSRFTLVMSLFQLCTIALVAALFGCIGGYLAQEWLLQALQGLLAADLPPPDGSPIVLGVVTAVVLLAGFAVPPLLQLAKVPAMRVLRRDMAPPAAASWLAFGPAVAAIVLLVYGVVRDPKFFFGFTLGLGIFVLVLTLAGWALVRFAGSLRGSVGVSWRYGVANLSRRRVDSIVQIVAFGLGIMVLLLLAVVRNDLLTDWRRSLPADLPNFFFINIPSEEREAFFGFLEQQGAATSRQLPMIRARLVELNDQAVESMEFADPRGEGYARRDQNITWQADLGDDNDIVAGRWWGEADHGRALVSISDEYQQGLGLKLGDRMTFDIAGETIEAEIASVRKIKWDSFQPNFFVVFPPGLLDELAGTWMTSAYFKPDDARVISELVRRFPSVSVFDLDDLLVQVRGVIDKAALAVQSVFVFTLFAGLTVLLAAVQATRDERRYESAMLRTLGASRKVVVRGILAEFSALGLLAGILAASGASIAGYFLAQQILQVGYEFSLTVWLLGAGGGALLVALAGWLATRNVLAEPPASSLR